MYRSPRLIIVEIISHSFASATDLILILILPISSKLSLFKTSSECLLKFASFLWSICLLTIWLRNASLPKRYRWQRGRIPFDRFGGIFTNILSTESRKNYSWRLVNSCVGRSLTLYWRAPFRSISYISLYALYYMIPISRKVGAIFFWATWAYFLFFWEIFFLKPLYELSSG